MKLEINQVWVSQTHPHESFRIHGGMVDTCADAFKDESIPFSEQPETAKIFFWERVDREEFIKYVDKKNGENAESTHPYAWCGASKKYSLTAKIRKFNMVQSD